MAGKVSSVASNSKLEGQSELAGVINRLIRNSEHLEEWAPCARCAHGALAHGFDEPQQTCIYGDCVGYRRFGDRERTP
jgi:hypothetical protein